MKPLTQKQIEARIKKAPAYSVFAITYGAQIKERWDSTELTWQYNTVRNLTREHARQWTTRYATFKIEHRVQKPIKAKASVETVRSMGRLD